MAEKHDPKELVTFGELSMINTIEKEALVNLKKQTIRKGRTKKHFISENPYGTINCFPAQE